MFLMTDVYYKYNKFIQVSLNIKLLIEKTRIMPFIDIIVTHNSTHYCGLEVPQEYIFA